MKLREVKRLVDSTSDPALAVDGLGSIAAWNKAATAFFGIEPDGAIGRPCDEIMQGTDECGTVCSQDCTVQRVARDGEPVKSFDIQVAGREGRRWCNVSVLVAQDGAASLPYTIHVIRPIDVQKRLEFAVRDFVVRETNLPGDQVVQLLASKRSATSDVDLTARELEILRLSAASAASSAIAAQLGISRTTVNNHMQHILRKLDAHTRLEAIRKAERAGLL
ncbi:MAG: PAS domain-containing protein [Blastocatellia bacterium]|nr:PAS domain-containing protein [Blastocatellia bacterium]